METPTLYTKSGCPWCQKAREVLDERNIEYGELNVTEDEPAFEEMQKISGQSYAPVLNWGGNILADFGPDELRGFLRRERIETAN